MVRAKSKRQVNPHKIKPIYVMFQEGTTDLDEQAVISGASELIQLAEVSGIDIKDFGVWRTNKFRNPDGSLKKYHSVDWYVERAKQSSRNGSQLNAITLLTDLCNEPWRSPKKGGTPHYDILVVSDDMYFGNLNLSIGIGQHSYAAVISTNKFRSFKGDAKLEFIKTATMHELGHVFGLIPEDRTESAEESYGDHCTNTCIMRQGKFVPDDWIKMTEDRLNNGALCELCAIDLYNYFRK